MLNLRDQFELSYSEHLNIPVSFIKAKRDGNSYNDATVAGAFQGWLLHEDHVSDARKLLDNLTLFVKRFFVTYRAFGVYTSPIAKYKENEYQRDARERMTALFEEGTTLVAYDQHELDTMIDAEAPQDEIAEPVISRMSVNIKELPKWSYGESTYTSSKSFTFGYLPVYGNYWLDEASARSYIANGIVPYTVSTDGSKAEYVDVIVTRKNDTPSSRRHIETLQQEMLQSRMFGPPVKTVFEIEKGFIIRFMIEHEDFLKKMKED